MRRLGPRVVRLYPLYHPAAALYTPSMLEILRTDFHRIPALLALDAPEQPAPAPVEPVEPEPVVPMPDLVEGTAPAAEPEPAAQLGLF